MRSHGVTYSLALLITFIIGSLLPLSVAKPVNINVDIRDAARNVWASAGNRRLKPRANPPVYTGPKDDDNVPTMDGVRAFTQSSWPDPTFTKDSVFFTGFTDGVDRTLAERFTQSKGALWFEDVFPVKGNSGSSDFISQQKGIADDDRWKVIARPSQAYAELSTGTAWLIIPKGVSEEDPYPGPASDGGRMANWASFEYPVLTRSGKITQIIRVNPDDFTDTQVLWKAGDAPFGDAPDGAEGSQPGWKSKPFIELDPALQDPDA